MQHYSLIRVIVVVGILVIGVFQFGQWKSKDCCDPR